VPPAESLLFPAACVEEALGRQVDRFDLLHRVVTALFMRRGQIGVNTFLADWDARLAFKGEKVSINPPGETPFCGTLVGIDAQGSLRLREENGMERVVTAGDLTLRPILGI
jgi:BirA family transcriptional regulator, biotin operon repressor / biotin---[acetyl-CoA-carboxylase] ligase